MNAINEEVKFQIGGLVYDRFYLGIGYPHIGIVADIIVVNDLIERVKVIWCVGDGPGVEAIGQEEAFSYDRACYNLVAAQ